MFRRLLCVCANTTKLVEHPVRAVADKHGVLTRTQHNLAALIFAFALGTEAIAGTCPAVPGVRRVCTREVNIPKLKPGAEYVGHAFRCADGLIRWVTDQSQRGYLRFLWLDEQENVWREGSKATLDRWTGAWAPVEEVRAPQHGETYERALTFGGRCTYRVGG